MQSKILIFISIETVIGFNMCSDSSVGFRACGCLVVCNISLHLPSKTTRSQVRALVGANYKLLKFHKCQYCIYEIYYVMVYAM